MNKEEFIDYVTRNNCRYFEDKDEICITESISDVEYKNIRYIKDKKSIKLIFCEEDNQVVRDLTAFEIKVINYLGSKYE